MSLYDKLKTGIIGGGGLAEGRIFSLKPIDGSGDFAFGRNREGTRRNSSGVIVTEPTDMPRADYKFGRSCPAILSEPLSQNLIPWSEDFGNNDWIKGGSSVGVTNILAPDNNSFMTKIIESSLNERHGFLRLNTFVIGDNSSFVYVLKGGDRKVAIGNAGDINEGVFFDTINGVVEDEVGMRGEIIDLGSYYKCVIYYSVVITKSIGIWNYVNSSPVFSTGITYQGDGVSGAHIWGAQLEQSSYPTSYIPTAGSVSLPRQPDVIEQLPSVNNINSPKGTIFLRTASITTDEEERAITFSDGGINQIRIRYYNQGIGVRMIVDGVNVASFSTQQLDQTPFRNIAFNWDETSCSFWVDGEEIGSTTLTESYSADTLESVVVAGTNDPFRGWLEELDIYDNNDIDMEDLTDYNTFEDMANNFLYSIQ